MRTNYSIVQITESLLIGYFEFQFSRYSGIKTPRGKNNIMLNWVIGQKAMQAWLTRNIKKRYFVKWKINKDFKLKLKLAFKSEVKVNNGPSFLNQLNQYEEQEKQRFHNTPDGYGYCAMMTTLYTPNSILCRSCKFKLACIERLKINFNNLYQKRTHGLTNRITAISISSMG
ncbi:MAG TPA: hypothetical protein VK890_06305 [Bacteroidia bacterium]|nr:hypothetical protein [Bacteroidia bacterium]